MCNVINTHLLIFALIYKNTMRKLIYIFSVCFLLSSCNDGDIIDIELDFDEELELCDILSEDYLLYDTRTDPNESLTLFFPSTPANDLIFNPEESGNVKTLTVNTSTIRFNYRTYSGNPELVICQEIPDAGVDITNDYEAVSGALVNFISTYIDDDNDGIPSEYEDDDLDGDGDYLTDPLDSDGDGTPDYIDADDDNDNVLTKDEIDDSDGDSNPLTNPLNTDGDSLPDYLDTDDDGDGVPTIYENEDGLEELENGVTLSLLDDFKEPSTIRRYLDSEATDVFMNDALNSNSYERTVTIDITIENANIEILSTDEIFFGTYTKVIEFTED